VKQVGLLLVAAAAVAACDSSNPALPTPTTQTASARAINASKLAVDVNVDGQLVVHGLAATSVSDQFFVTPGTHTVQFLSPNGPSATTSVTADTSKHAAVYAFSPSATTLAAGDIADTDAVVPANKSKLRVTNLTASLGTNEIWRTQPDFQSPVHVATPFPFGLTSPYLQSDPGVWEVFVTPPGGGVKLATTGPISIPAGERRSVVLMDTAGVLRFKVFE